MTTNCVEKTYAATMPSEQTRAKYEFYKDDVEN